MTTSENTAPAGTDNETFIREITGVYDNVYHLNDRYGMVLSISRHHSQREMLTVHLLQEAHGHLNAIMQLLQRVDQEKILPERSRAQFSDVKMHLMERIAQWRIACCASLESSDYCNSDLGIEAARIALDAKVDLSFLLISHA